MSIKLPKKVKEQYQKAIREFVVDGLGSTVMVYKQPLKAECPNCFYDTTTNKSTNTCKWTLPEAIQKQNEHIASGGIGVRYKYFSVGRCPICKGIGYLETVRKTPVKCAVTWNPKGTGENTIVSTVAGSTNSTIAELKTLPKYFDLFKNSLKVIVDGIECKVAAIPILRGLGGQSLAVISVYTTDKFETGTPSEIIKNYG